LGPNSLGIDVRSLGATVVASSGMLFDHKTLSFSLLFNQACNKFTLLADHSDKVPNLKGKKYSDFLLTDAEWDILELMKEVLEVRASFSIRLFSIY
jgi:hypothetical protein